MEITGITDGIVPRLLPDMGLPYRGSDTMRVRSTPSGLLLRASRRYPLPFPKDRLPVYYLAAVAADSAEAMLSLSDMIDWVGKRRDKPWRQSQLVARLRRLLECRIEDPYRAGDFRFADFYAIDEPADKLYIRFSTEFQHAAQNGAVVSREHVRALSGHPFALEVYTKLRLILTDGIWARKWDLRRSLRSKGTRHHFGSKLKNALGLIAQIWPDMPFHREQVQCVSCHYDTFRVHAHGADLEAEKAALAAEIAGMSRAQVREHIRQQPEWRRRKLYIDYMYDWMAPAAMEQIAQSHQVNRRAADTARAIEARTAKMRALSQQADAVSSQLRTLTVTDPGAEVAEAEITIEAGDIRPTTMETDDIQPVTMEANDIQPVMTEGDDVPTGATEPGDDAQATGKIPDESSAVGEDRPPDQGRTSERPGPRSTWRRLTAAAGRFAARVPGTNRVMDKLAREPQRAAQSPHSKKRTAREFTEADKAIIASAARIVDEHGEREEPGSLSSAELAIIEKAQTILGVPVGPTTDSAGRFQRLRRAVRSAVSRLRERTGREP